MSPKKERTNKIRVNLQDINHPVVGEKLYIAANRKFFTRRTRNTRWNCDWSSDVCSSDLLSRQADGAGSASVGLIHLPEQSLCGLLERDRKRTRLNSSHSSISYTVFF